MEYMKHLTTLLTAVFITGWSLSAHAAAPTVSILPFDARAAEAGAESGHFIVRRSHGLANSQRIHFRVLGEAINGLDYETIPTSVVIPAGRFGALIRVRPIDDALGEGLEQVAIQLVPFPGRAVQPYRIGANRVARVRIIDNDPIEPAEITLAPTAIGTIGYQPELGTFSAFSNDDLQSAYFRLESTREFRRAFLEFPLPALSGHVVSAVLKMHDESATSGGPLDVHDLSYYLADLVVQQSDYTNETTFVSTFTTDPNQSREPIEVDVTQPVAQWLGARLGLRVKVATDPNEDGTRSFGAEFQSIIQPPHILIRSTQRPHLVITSPANGTTVVAPGTFQIKTMALDQDGYVANVEFFANGAKIGERVRTNPPPAVATLQRPSLVWSDVPPGEYNLMAVATDNEGARSPVAVVTVFVQGAP